MIYFCGIMDNLKEIQEIFCDKNYTSLSLLTESLENFFKKRNTFCNTSDPIDFDVVDEVYLSELKDINTAVNICFGNTIKDLKCVICDEDGIREHEIYIKYKSSRKYIIKSVNLPFSPYQDKEYKTLKELLNTFRNHINSLSNYFLEMENIDKLCPVVEPLHPTYKDDYRKILLDDRTWLHIEVTPEGMATNIHLIGHIDNWNDKLHLGLLSWDHDKDIVDNIMTMFDISSFPLDLNKMNPNEPEWDTVEKQTCGICLCNELPDNPGVPQPLCQNATCGIYFHRSCLFEWLLVCTGGRPPTFGVVTGNCPTCLHTISCCESDDRICK